MITMGTVKLLKDAEIFSAQRLGDKGRFLKKDDVIIDVLFPLVG